MNSSSPGVRSDVVDERLSYAVAVVACLCEHWERLRSEGRTAQDALVLLEVDGYKKQFVEQVLTMVCLSWDKPPTERVVFTQTVAHFAMSLVPVAVGSFKQVLEKRVRMRISPEVTDEQLVFQDFEASMYISLAKVGRGRDSFDVQACFSRLRLLAKAAFGRRDLVGIAAE